MVQSFHPLGYSLERSRSACGYNRQKHQHKIYMHALCYAHAHVQQVEWLLKTMFKKPLVLTSDPGFPCDVADT